MHQCQKSARKRSWRKGQSILLPFSEHVFILLTYTHKWNRLAREDSKSYSVKNRSKRINSGVVFNSDERTADPILPRKTSGEVSSSNDKRFEISFGHFGGGEKCQKRGESSVHREMLAYLQTISSSYWETARVLYSQKFRSAVFRADM